MLQENAIHTGKVGNRSEHYTPHARCDADADKRQILVVFGELFCDEFADMHIGHKVAEESDGNRHCPNDVFHLLPVVEIDDGPRDVVALRSADFLLFHGRQWLQWLVNDRENDDKHREECQKLQASLESIVPLDARENNWQNGGEHGRPRSDKATDDAEIFLEVMAKNCQCWRVSESCEETKVKSGFK